MIPMQLNSKHLILVSTLWLGSLAATFYFGKTTGETTASQNPATGSNAQSSSNKSPGGNANSAKSAVAADTIPLKTILAQMKTMMRGGGSMQNPNTMMKLMGLLDKISPDDFPAALAEAEGMTDPQSKMLLQMAVLGKWAATDGPGAMKYAEEHSKNMGMMAQMAKMSVASAWAENDPEAVWKWYQSTKDGDNAGPMGGGMVLVSLFSNMAAKNPEQAFKRLAEIEGPSKQMALAGMFQSALFDADKRNAILVQVDAMPDKSERDQAKQSMLSQWMMMAPDEATDYIKSQPAADQTLLRQTAGQMLMMNDPKKGAAFMMDGATDADRAERYSTVISSWAHTDTNAAGNWLNSQPKGPELDKAKQSFVYAAATKDPESAMTWASTITDENTKTAAVTHAYTTWKKTDATAAEKALQASGLTPEKIQAVQTKGNLLQAPAAGPTATESLPELVK
jgi:hypothetical protein